MKNRLKTFISKFFLAHLIKMHSRLYTIIGVLLIDEKSGSHPKHEILNYQKWYVDKVSGSWTILDIGSGKGVLTSQIAPYVKKIYGIDINKINHDLSRENFNCKNIEWIHGDALTFDFQVLGRIDAIVLSNVLEHIEDRIEFLRNLIEHVKWGEAGPTFLIRVPTIERDWLTIYKRMQGFEYRLDRTHFIEFTEQELSDELSKCFLTFSRIERRFDEYFVTAKLKIDTQL